MDEVTQIENEEVTRENVQAALERNEQENDEE